MESLIAGGISCLVCMVGMVIFFINRKEPVMKFRQYQSLFFGDILLLLSGMLAALALYFHEHHFDWWEDSCVILISLNICAANPWTGVSMVLRAFSIQFQYYWNYAKMKAKKSEEGFYERHKNFANPTKVFIYLLLVGSMLTLPIFIFVGTPASAPGQNTHSCFDPFFFIYLGQTFLLIIAFGYIILKFIHFRDPFLIKAEFFTKFFVLVFSTVPFIVLSIMAYFPYEIYLPPSLEPVYFYLIYCFLYPPISLWMPIFVLFREKWRERRHQLLDLEAHHDATLIDVLNSKVLMEAFSNVVAEHWCSESLLFIIEYQKYLHSDIASRPEIARKIFYTFIERGSRYEINIDEEEAEKIENKILTEQFDETIFHQAELDVLGQLEGIYLRWRGTPEYIAVLERHFRSKKAQETKASVDFQGLKD